MKTLPILVLPIIVVIAAGCQNSSKHSGSMTAGQTDNEVTLRATSNDGNVAVDSDGKQARLHRTPENSSGAAIDSTGQSDRGEGFRSSDNDTAASTRVSSGSTANTVAVDNTARNSRDRTDPTLTPEDQGSSASDIDLTRKIRRAVVQSGELSTYAKNIKIITVNGKVTLRGPVNSQEEKNTIESLAQNAAAGAVVDNQLEVKTTNQ